MRYWLHPERLRSTKSRWRQPGLGHRYHAAFRSVMTSIGEAPERFRVIVPPAIRQAPLKGFPFKLIYRQTADKVQVLAIAHRRRRPHYGLDRA